MKLSHQLPAIKPSLLEVVNQDPVSFADNILSLPATDPLPFSKFSNDRRSTAALSQEFDRLVDALSGDCLRCHQSSKRQRCKISSRWSRTIPTAKSGTSSGRA